MIDEKRQVRVKTNEPMPDYDRRYESNISNWDLFLSLVFAAITVVGLVALVFMVSS